MRLTFPNPNTIQLWHKNGSSVTYRGESEPYEILDGEKWRPATPKENIEIRLEELAEIYVRRDVLCCDSMLIDELLKESFSLEGDLAEEFAIDNVENLYPTTEEWTAKECKNYLDDLGADFPPVSNPWDMRKEKIVDELNSLDVEQLNLHEDEDQEIENLRLQLFNLIDEGDWGEVDDWQQAVEIAAQDDPTEVFEWWRVSDWLYRQLQYNGEVVLSNAYGQWWGRSCTGQQMIMDGIFQRIAARVMSAYA